MIMKIRNTYGPIASWTGEKDKPTRKLADQLTATAILVAMGLPDCANSSDTKNHGIEPGPTVNKPIFILISAFVNKVYIHGIFSL